MMGIVGPPGRISFSCKPVQIRLFVCFSFSFFFLLLVRKSSTGAAPRGEGGGGGAGGRLCRLFPSGLAQDFMSGAASSEAFCPQSLSKHPGAAPVCPNTPHNPPNLELLVLTLSVVSAVTSVA